MKNKRTLVNSYIDIVLVTRFRIFCTNNNIKVVIQNNAFLTDPFVYEFQRTSLYISGQLWSRYKLSIINHFYCSTFSIQSQKIIGSPKIKVFWPSPVIIMRLKWKRSRLIWHGFIIKLLHYSIDQLYINVRYHNKKLIEDCLSIISSFIYVLAFKIILLKIYFYYTYFA